MVYQWLLGGACVVLMLGWGYLLGMCIAACDACSSCILCKHAPSHPECDLFLKLLANPKGSDEEPHKQAHQQRCTCLAQPLHLLPLEVPPQAQHCC